MRKRLAAVFAVATLCLAGLALTAPAAAANEDHDYGYCNEDDPNFILGSPQVDLLHGTTRSDLIIGFGSNDRLVGRGCPDILRGGRGDDRLNGVEVFTEPTRDFLRGGPGFDRCIGDLLDVFVSCEDSEVVV